MFNHLSVNGHHRLHFQRCPKTGLKAVIAIHNQDYGLSLGGTRIVPYATEGEAVADVLRLSRAMTFKAACAGVPVGGAKGVIMGDPAAKKEFLPAYAEFVDSLGGRFVTGQDLNLTPDDVLLLAERTRYIVGLAPIPYDPASMTAYGVLIAMRAAVKHRLQKSSMNGIRVAIQGLGNVGWLLAELLHKEGAELSVADVDAAKTVRAKSEFGAKIVDTAAIHRADVDLFSPCARGGVLHEETLRPMPASIIVGAANNQLADELEDGALIRRLGKIFCPDFVANSGGLIAVYHEFIKAPPEQLRSRVESIYETATRIFQQAEVDDTCQVTAGLDVAVKALASLQRANLRQ